MPGARRAGATLLYLISALPMGALIFAVLTGGWILVLVFAITPLVVPLLIVLRAAVGLLAGAEAWLARTLVGASVQPRWVPDAGHGGYFRRGAEVLGDEVFWKRQGFLVLRHYLGGAVTIVELSLLAAGLGAIAAPIYSRWAHIDIGSWHHATIVQSLVFVPAGIIAVVLALWMLGPIESVSCSLADGLLGDGAAPTTAPAAGEPPPRPASRRQRLAMAAVTIAGICLVQIVIWMATGGPFWPAWTIISLGAPLAFFAWLELLRERPEIPARLRMSRGMAIHVGAAVAICVYLMLVWALGGGGSFWPIYPILVAFGTLVVHAILDVNRSIRSGPLAQRIDVLETTRAGAVNQQEAELRRIERDLHDGAQARLVALGMSLGMAQQKLASSDPDAAQALLADARIGAQEALHELRDLARGIHPPVLADRGLEAAIAALADRTPLRVGVAVSIDERPAAPVETAAYFVVAEALTNAAKHSQATNVDIAIGRVGSTLIVEIADDGIGGANAGGSGLTGLARRVQALDGRLSVDSPHGGPTRIRAVMPCGS